MSNKNTISCIYNIVYNMKGNNMTWIIYITTEKKNKVKTRDYVFVLCKQKM